MIATSVPVSRGLDLCKGRGPFLGVTHLIRRNAIAYPDTIAIGFGDVAISYRDLEDRSERLAQRLQELGVGKETLTGLLVDRSPAMVVAMLSILKAGGAYVPLDPQYPCARIEETLADAGVGLLVSEGPVLARLGLRHSAKVLLLEEPMEASPTEPREAVEASAEDTAYVIFTSGSTGKPKGVEVSQGALVNLLCSLAEKPGMERTDSLLAVTSVAFDIAAAELLLPLMVGGRVELASTEEAGDPHQMIAKLSAAKISLLQATPVTWRLLILAGWTGTRSLRVWCGGEEMTQSLARDLLERSTDVWNLYGPTETTVWSSVMRVERAERVIPLGSPVADTELYVLDEDLRQVEVGITGELCIGGAGLAKGYWRQPGLTEASFPTVRLKDGRLMRLYRTGDRARFTADGRLEFLGRADRQVKMRGYRIELGEIEHAGRGCAGIQEVVVMKIEDDVREPLLAAFAVATQHSGAGAGELRRHLAERLPGYMVPSAIRMVERLPTTANGKLDRKQMVGLTNDAVTVLDVFDEPREGLESVIAPIWMEALGVGVLGRHDNFFAHGGDSLLAAHVETAMSKEVDLRCSAGSLLRSPTMALYAAYLRGEGVLPAILLQTGRLVDDTIFWMDNPDRLPMLAGLMAGRRFYSMLLSQEDMAQEAPRYPLERLASRMVEHILGLQTTGRFTIGGFCQNALLAYEVGRQLQERGYRVPLLIMVDPGDCLGSTRNRLSFDVVWKRIEREWFHLGAMLRLPVSGWGQYVRRRYEGMRFELDGRRWQRAARSGDARRAKMPVLAQALFASRVSYVPLPYPGRVLFIEPTLRPQHRNNLKATGWRSLAPHGQWASVVGDHLGLFASPSVENLAIAIQNALDENLAEEVTASS